MLAVRKRVSALAMAVALSLTTVAAVVLVPALPAQAITVTTGDPTPWYSMGSKTCPVGTKVGIRVYTYDFLWFDSWGSTFVRWRPSSLSAWTTRIAAGEHDGVTRNFPTGFNSIQQGQAFFDNLHWSGVASITYYCY